MAGATEGGLVGKHLCHSFAWVNIKFLGLQSKKDSVQMRDKWQDSDS